MTKFTYTDGISTAKIIYYVPAVLISIFILFRHGFCKNSGWIYLAIFCVVRIINGAAQLATINNSNPATALEIALITGFLGLSPLLLASLGLLSRV
jgi:hypothetical protein